MKWVQSIQKVTWSAGKVVEGRVVGVRGGTHDPVFTVKTDEGSVTVLGARALTPLLTDVRDGDVVRITCISLHPAEYAVEKGVPEDEDSSQNEDFSEAASELSR